MAGKKADSLLEKLKRGDRSAFNQIYKLYWHALYVHAYKRIDDTELTEDFVQEAFIQLWEKRSEVEIHTSVEQYLHGILRNNILQHFRKVYAQKEQKEAFTLSQQMQQEHTEVRIIHRDLLEKIDILIGKLPRQSRRVFELSRKEGFSNREIAEQLHITVKAVEYHINYALKYIREHCPEYALLALLLFKSFL